MVALDGFYCMFWVLKKKHLNVHQNMFKLMNKKIITILRSNICLSGPLYNWSMKLILLINVKMPTIVGILTFISRINIASESIKARNISLIQHFSFKDRLKLHAQLSMKKVL